MARRLEVLTKIITSNFHGWCNTDSNVFRSLSRWLDGNKITSLSVVSCHLLAKQLLNNIIALAPEDEERFLSGKYAIACLNIASILHDQELEVRWADEKQVNRTSCKILTLLSGRAMLYTALDCLIVIRQLDSSVTSEDEERASALLLFLSSHPSYYRVRPDKLAAATIFYCNSDLRGLVLEKKEYRFNLSVLASTVEIVQGMIDQLIRADPERSLERYWPAPLKKSGISPRYLTSVTQDIHDVSVRSSRATSRVAVQNKELGSGVSGSVFKARSGTVFVAVKIQQQGRDAIRELVIMCTLSSSNIQSARSFSFEGDNVLIHMSIQHSLLSIIYSSHTEEETEDVHDSVWIEGKSTPFEVVNLITRRGYARQLLQGLIYLADVGIIHGDIKPSNLLVSNAGVLKIADFGLSILYSPSLDFSLEHTDVLLYAPAYRDPNIDKKSKRFSFEADVWAASVTILQMEIGILPILSRPGVNFGCIRDRALITVCSQMLARDIYSRVSARQAIVAFE